MLEGATASKNARNEILGFKNFYNFRLDCHYRHLFHRQLFYVLERPERKQVEEGGWEVPIILRTIPKLGIIQTFRLSGLAVAPNFF